MAAQETPQEVLRALEAGGPALVAVLGRLPAEAPVERLVEAIAGAGIDLEPDEVAVLVAWRADLAAAGEVFERGFS